MFPQKIIMQKKKKKNVKRVFIDIWRQNKSN